MKDVFLVVEAAEYLMVSRGTIYNYIKKGFLDAFKINRTTYVTQQSIDEFIELSNQRGFKL